MLEEKSRQCYDAIRQDLLYFLSHLKRLRKECLTFSIVHGDVRDVECYGFHQIYGLLKRM